MAMVAAFFPGRRLLPGDGPDHPVVVIPAWPTERRALGRVYNRLGGLMGRLAGEFQIEVPAVLAVWYVESSGREHTPGRAIIRFENHVLFDQWGRFQPTRYDQHFQHGGRPPRTQDVCRGASGDFAAWKCHHYREQAAGAFVACHQSQDQEYEVLALATALAGEDIALRCISIGGPQIMGFNFATAGFASPRALYDAFQASEGAQVRGFFAFSQRVGTPGQAIGALRGRDWATFARLYNGAGNVATYAALLQSAYVEARQLF
jgi:hypothetical protein